jgi:hypothetical protein
MGTPSSGQTRLGLLFRLQSLWRIFLKPCRNSCFIVAGIDALKQGVGRDEEAQDYVAKL